MSRKAFLDQVEESFLKQDPPVFEVGDSVRVYTRIAEGSKERTQVFAGTVVSKRGEGLSETFSVYRNAYGCSMEKVFAIHSPRIERVEVLRSGKVRRAKLYYLRGETGKKARLKSTFRGAQAAAELPANEASVEPNQG